MYFGLGVVQTKLGSASTSFSTGAGITYSEVSETYKKNNYKVIFALVVPVPVSVVPVSPIRDLYKALIAVDLFCD
jgi:hypothetical protein